jgi:hypothetical protein
MSVQAFGKGAAQAAGANLANAVLSTPQGQAATVATVALAVAAAPALMVVGGTAAVVYAAAKVAERLGF